MALVLAVAERDEIFVGDERIDIAKLYEDGSCDIYVQGKAIHVTDQRSIEILPNVLISTGIKSWNKKQCRLVFKAPRTITILRGERYWNGKSDAGFAPSI